MDSPWVKRAAVAEDEPALLYMWLKGYAHSRENVKRGANRDHSPAENEYWREHAPIVESLLRTQTTEVLCDPARVHYEPDKPAQIYAFACTTGDVVHWVCVKRTYARDRELRDFCVDMVKDLLGSRLERACRYTHELTEMRRHEVRPAPCGVALPESWWEDKWWVERQMLGGARAA